MRTYTVTNTIQSLDLSNPPIDVQWYKGNDLAFAMAALVQAAAHHHDDEDSNLPEKMRYKITRVHMEIEE